jgi:hypothetical protein
MRLVAATLAAALSIAVNTGCSMMRPAPLPPTEAAQALTGGVDVVSRGALLFEGALDDLYPCHDGDVVAYRVNGGPRSGEIMISRTFALKKAGDFRITNTYGKELAEALHLRVDGSSILVVSQVDADQDVGITFARPLPLVSVPLHSGVTSFHSPVRIWRPSSGRTMGDGEVALTLSVNEEAISGYDRAFATTQTGTFKLMRQTFDVESTAWLAPGLGEVQARRIQGGAETETFALVCARINGTEVVDCGAVASALNE